MEYWVKNPIFVQANLTEPIIPEFHYSTIPTNNRPPHIRIKLSSIFIFGC
jgi:hypothetical protein